MRNNYVIFSDFKELELDKGCFSAAQLLLKPRKFDFIKIGFDMLKRLSDIRIDTKELILEDVSVGQALGTESIKTNSLIIDLDIYGSVDDLFITNIRFVFCFEFI